MYTCLYLYNCRNLYMYTVSMHTYMHTHTWANCVCTYVDEAVLLKPRGISLRASAISSCRGGGLRPAAKPRPSSAAWRLGWRRGSTDYTVVSVSCSLFIPSMPFIACCFLSFLCLAAASLLFFFGGMGARTSHPVSRSSTPRAMMVPSAVPRCQLSQQFRAGCVVRVSTTPAGLCPQRGCVMWFLLAGALSWF